MEKLMSKKAIIFDMDGTILNTIDDITGAVNYILGKYNMPLRSVDEVRYFVGNGLHRTLELSVPEGSSMELVDSIYEEFVLYYRVHSNINTRPYDGIVETLTNLKEAGYRLAVVSNKRQEAVEGLCQVFYKGLFEVISGDREGIRRKPAPDMVDKVIESFGVSKEETVYIGDSDVDIMTAKNSEIDGIFVSWGFRGKEFLKEHGAKIIADSPSDLLYMIAGIN